MGALDAGLKFYFGYPITPQNDIPEYLSFHLPKAGGAFIQAESEIASINMVLGAAATGKRAMTSSSSPGISLMQEGISYMAGSEIPGVIVNISRSGPGLGGISPSQGDYFQATRGGGHGDYRTMVLAPNSVQELYDLTIAAFDLADTYRNPVVILGDSILGQIKEPMVRHKADCPPARQTLGADREPAGRPPQLLKSLYLAEGELTVHNWKLKEKYDSMAKDARYDTYLVDDARLIVSAFGSVSRIVRTSIDRVREKGMKVGLLAPDHAVPVSPRAAVGAVAPRQGVLRGGAQHRPDGGGRASSRSRGMRGSISSAIPPARSRLRPSWRSSSKSGTNESGPYRRPIRQKPGIAGFFYAINTIGRPGSFILLTN